MKLELPTTYFPRVEDATIRVNALAALFPALKPVKPNAVLHVPAHKAVVAPVNG